MDIPDCVIRPRGPWASGPVSRGRLIPEPASPTRTDFQRDRDRVIHSTAFRRLKHKTQVFVVHEGDHFRTRLTHSIEVAQIARALARSLALDEDLAEALALSHDFGHTPFGHTGEEALDAAMRPYGGFDHNAQTLRVVTRLEERYAEFDGLNLCWETLEGLVKHNGPLIGPDGAPTARYRDRGIPAAILEYQDRQDLELATHASAEAQAASVADDIAYDAHDIDDGLRAELFSLDDLASVPLLADLLSEIRTRHPLLDEGRTTHEVVRRVITTLVEDVIAEGRRHLSSGVYLTPDEIRGAGRTLIGFSERMAAAEREIKAFLFRNMYRHPHVMRVRTQATSVVSDLFSRLFADTDLLPPDWRRGLEGAGEDRRARRVADYIAGMTDTFALEEHRRLFDTTPELR
jgi:dGTPase